VDNDICELTEYYIDYWVEGELFSPPDVSRWILEYLEDMRNFDDLNRAEDG